MKTFAKLASGLLLIAYAIRVVVLAVGETFRQEDEEPWMPHTKLLTTFPVRMVTAVLLDIVQLRDKIRELKNSPPMMILLTYNDAVTRDIPERRD